MPHNFKPIVSETCLTAAAEYVATSSLTLARTILNRELSIDTICFFTHTPEEYAYLLEAVRSRGTESRFSHGTTTYVDTDFTVADQHIRILGVRQPDKSKPWVGYGDYPVTEDEYMAFRSDGSPFIQEITSGRGQDLLELVHPEFDVVGYAFRKEDHSELAAD